MPRFTRPRILVVSAVPLVLALVSSVVAGSTIEIPVSQSRADVRVSGSEVTLNTKRAYPLREVGQPVLPYRIVNVLIPRGERVVDTRVVASAPVPLEKGFSARPAQAIATEDGRVGNSDGIATRSPDGLAFPGSYARYLSTGYYHGYTIASFAVFPLRIVGSTLEFTDRITLHIETAAYEGERGVFRLRQRPRLDRRDRARVAGLVENPSRATGYVPAGTRVAPGPGGFNATADPSLEGSAVDYVIITNDSLAAKWQRLADRKTARGVPAVVRTTEWIESRYRNGVDLQETIRNFVIDAYQRWGVSYVLLGGDTDQVPARLGASFYLGDKDVPVDMYYGCVDGDWNADHDEYFGEGGPSGDAPDLYQEVFVGRLPSASGAEVDILIDKLLEYEAPSDPTYTNRALLLAEVLFPIDWNGVDPIAVDGANISDFLYQVAFTSPSMSVTELYENYVPYPRSVQETVGAAIDSINTGYNFINHIGHGFRFNMSVGNGSILNGDADAFVNSARPSNVYLLNCTAVAYTYFCLAEHWLRNPNGGAVSVIGANESAFPIASQPYMNQYYSELFNNGTNTIAEAFVTSRLSRTSIAALGDNVDLWTHYIYSILADPEQQLFTGPIDSMTVVYTDSVGLGPSSLTVTVSSLSSGVPLPGATVCLSRTGEDYSVGVTDAAGQVVVPFTAETTGSISLVVTARNHSTWDGAVTVVDPGTAWVRFDAVTVVDDSTAATSGNGDGVLDAGEVAKFDVTLANGGSGPTGPLTVKLRTTSGGFSILDSVTTCVPLAAGQVASVDSSFRVSVSPFLTDETPLDFTVVVESAGVPLWTDQFRKLVHAPALDAVVLRVDDSLTGNGDGVVQSGEDVDIYFEVKNRGTGTGYGLTAELFDNSGGGAVILGALSTYPDLMAGAQLENVVPFQVREPDASVEHQLRMVVTDAHGRTYTRLFELRPPLPPDSLTFDPSLGPDRMHVVWKSSPSPDVSEYLVYRSINTGGPYARVSIDPVGHTVFVDHPLAATTRYYYRVTAVDASGNESALSPEFTASTNPAQVAGWPIVLPLETVSSPVIGDIDGDNDFEIVQGNDRVYAWHHDGNELIDADGNAQTWGLLSTQGDQFVSHIALSEVDTVAGFDIIAASRNTKEIYVFNYLGQVLPGWPQPVENAIRAGLVAGDIDGDGRREIIAIDEKGVLYVFRADGTEYRDGDNNPLTPGVFRRFANCVYQYGSPGVGDFDLDGIGEIVVGTQGDSLFIFNDDGSMLPGWPVALTGDVAGSPAVGDIDGDGILDVVAAQWDGPVVAYRADGTVIWQRWRKNYLSFSPSPALGDLNGSGTLETLIADANGQIDAITSAGADLPGWPVVYSTKTWTESSPIIADIDRDGSLDIILGDETKFINGWDAAGNLLDGFPLSTGDAVRATPTLADVDKDGDIDLVAAGWDKTVYVYDFPGMFDPHASPWASFHANLFNDGNLTTPLPTPVLNVSFGFELTARGVSLEFLVPASMGYRFDILRRIDRDVERGTWAAVARGVIPSGDGVVRLEDRAVDRGESYTYRIEPAGEPERGVSTRPVYIAITRAELEQNTPNPFNPATNIVYYIPDGGARQVALSVYDVRGALVARLVDGPQRGGRYQVDWDGRDRGGRRVASGMYFYRLTQPGFSATKKMLLLK